MNRRKKLICCVTIFSVSSYLMVFFFYLLLETISLPFKNDKLHVKLPTSDPVCSGETSISIRDIILSYCGEEIKACSAGSFGF